MYRILIVEDDPGIAREVSGKLTQWGYDALIAPDLKDITGTFKEFDPHLVLMDIMLPYYDGFYWCGEIRKISKVPIVFISSASDNMSIVMAMNMGGDDFIVKPFDMTVLTAKVNAVLRRAYDLSMPLPEPEYNGVELNTGAGTASYNGERIDLTKNEYRILFCLMENKGRTVSREKLMESLWATDEFVDENTLTVNVNRLRKKLAAAGVPDIIKTRFGVGYMIGED